MRKKTLIRIFKILGKTLVVFIGLVVVYILAAFTLSRITIEGATATEKPIAIYIKTNGVHTDIVVPIKNEFYDWSQKIKFENTTSKDTTSNFVALGWGYNIINKN